MLRLLLLPQSQLDMPLLLLFRAPVKVVPLYGVGRHLLVQGGLGMVLVLVVTLLLAELRLPEVIEADRRGGALPEAGRVEPVVLAF